jgi:xanthine/uracil permease
MPDPTDLLGGAMILTFAAITALGIILISSPMWLQ